MKGRPHVEVPYPRSEMDPVMCHYNGQGKRQGNRSHAKRRSKNREDDNENDRCNFASTIRKCRSHTKRRSEHKPWTPHAKASPTRKPNGRALLLKTAGQATREKEQTPRDYAPGPHPRWAHTRPKGTLRSVFAEGPNIMMISSPEQEHPLEDLRGRGVQTDG